MPKVSAIIPVYNVEKYLRRCLDSVINQTLKDIEIICVNDGSKDSSLDILKEFASKDNRIIIINQENQGLSKARNTGMEVAKGDYIAFLDSDDFIDLNFYEKLYNTAIENNADVACAGIIRENNKKSKKLVIYDCVEIKTNIKEKFNLIKAPQYCFVWNKIYKKEALLNSDIKFINGIFYEDMPFTCELLGKISNVVSVPETFYHYWKNPNSTIKILTDKSRADKLFAKKYLIDKCFEYGIKLSEKESLISKKSYLFFGIPVIKCYQYRATKKYYLFNILPFLTIEENA